MAKVSMSFYEAIYNSVLSGMVIEYDDGDGIEEKTIDYVKVSKKTRQIQVHCVDADVFLCSEDDMYNFIVTAKKNRVKPNRKRNRSKRNNI